MATPCPFCEGNVDYVIRRGKAAALYDSFPVNPGHVLVVPVAHKADLLSCSPEEVADMWEVIEAVIDRLKERYNPDGFNIGTNIGATAGQTVFHCHIHVIPRYQDDTQSPRGGVRKVKESLIPYD